MQLLLRSATYFQSGPHLWIWICPVPRYLGPGPMNYLQGLYHQLYPATVPYIFVECIRLIFTYKVQMNGTAHLAAH